MRAQLTEEWNSAQPVERIAFVLVAVASFLNILLGLFNYPVIGDDAHVHLNWLDQFTRIASQGISYPRWLPDSFGGFGSPTFYFYPPMVYWAANFIHIFGIASPSMLFHTLQLSFSFASFLSSFLLIRQLHGKQLPAIVAALLYSFLAYRFCNVYTRNALTEHVALAILPLIFLQFRDRITSITILAISWATLLLTSLPISYLALFASFLVSIARRSSKDLFVFAITFVIAVATSAIYLFPVFALRGFIHQRHLFDSPMNTSEFGFAILDIFQGRISWLKILSCSTIIVGIGSLIVLAKNAPAETRAWKRLIALSVFFQIPFISAPLWHIIPGMPFVQFSWRWDGILLLAIAMASAGVSEESMRTKFSFFFIGLALITILSELTISRNLFTRPPLPINSFRVDAPEYAPKWTSNDPNEVIAITERRMSDPPAVMLGFTMPGDTVSLISKSPKDINFQVNLSRATPIRFHQFYWTYWKLHRDYTEIPLAPDPNGFAVAQLPAGKYSIALELEKSKSEIAGRTVSFIGLAILAILLAVRGYRWIIKRREAISSPVVTRKM